MNIFQPVEIPFFAALLLLLLFAKLMGEIFERLGQPSIIGEIIAGIALGPSVFNIIQTTTHISVLSELAVFMLVIIAGLEISLEELKHSITGKNLWYVLTGFVIPFFFGGLLGAIFDYSTVIITFIALCFTITALPVGIRILMDLGILNTEVGKRIIAIAIFNDVASLMILGVLLDLKNVSDDYFVAIASISYALLKVIGFLTVLVVAYKLFEKTSQRIHIFKNGLNKVLSLLKGKEGLFAIVFLFILVFSSISEIAGLHFVVGAFFGALLLSEDLLGKENFTQIQNTTNSMTMGFLAPIFFASIGLQFDFHSLTSWSFLAALLGMSFFSKIVGGLIGGKMAGSMPGVAVSIGIGLNVGGLMELVIANIGLTNGLIDKSLFTTFVVLVMITTIVTPILLKFSYSKFSAKHLEAKI